jgi:micrococcal nuclease
MQTAHRLLTLPEYRLNIGIRQRSMCFLLVFACIVGCLSATLSGQPAAGALDSRFADLIGKDVAATVTTVTDGDTFEVVFAGEKRAVAIRLLGVDTPERNEPLYEEARRATRTLLFDKSVSIRAVRVERNGRLTASVRIGQTSIASELVRRGLACHDTDYSSDESLARLERQAKASNLGVWGIKTSKPRCVARKEGLLQTAGFRGNTTNKIYHAASCRNFQCRNCTVFFANEAAAKAAGYRRAKDCF